MAKPLPCRIEDKQDLIYQSRQNVPLTTTPFYLYLL